MDDLLDNFTSHNLDSPAEEGYKYHFVDGSPAGSEHETSIHPAAAASRGPNSDNPFFSTGSHPTTDGESEDDGEYNAYVDDDDDEHPHDEASPDEASPDEASPDEAFHNDPINESSYPEKPLLENESGILDRFSHGPSYGAFPTHDASSRSINQYAEPSLASSDDEKDGLNGFAPHLRRLHRQDMERDEFLKQLYQENVDLKRALKKSIPGGNPRAEAAERSLFEIRKTLDKNPYVCVLIDGRGYKIHENLLQLGKRGGAEAADRMWAEVSNYLQQYSDANHWEIMVHLYIDVEGLLARCFSNDILLSYDDVRDFMMGFTQARSLFTIADVGNDPESLSRKVEDMFHIFVNNIQCKHVIFGCCHDVSYAVALESYISNPITASSITLLKSYEDKSYFEGLPLNSVELPQVFRSTPFKETDILAEDDDYMQSLPQKLNSGYTKSEAEKSSANEAAGEDKVLAKWQAAANASVPLPARSRSRPQTKVYSGWATEKNVLLNINDERIDHELGEVNHETSESMLDRMEVQRFCIYYHLQNFCLTVPQGKTCNFRHGPKLNKDELRFLKQYLRRSRCEFGSRCRKPDCLYGHVCPNQPGCERGPTCAFYRFHEVDKTAVRIWSPEKNGSPRKK